MLDVPTLGEEWADVYDTGPVLHSTFSQHVDVPVVLRDVVFSPHRVTYCFLLYLPPPAGFFSCTEVESGRYVHKSIYSL